MTIALTLWIFAAAFLACSGWILSALGTLDRVGYAVALFIGFSICFGILRQAAVRPRDALLLFRKIKRRLRRPMPLAFLLIVVFSFVGGALYDPVHYDSLSYRIPRVLHWLAEGRWHWIHTEDIRLNVVAPGIEWIWTPLFLFFQSERWLYLVSAVSLIFLPGLVFGCFTRLGVRPRVAWWWMWIIPSGYCYAMQGGSLATDGCSAVFALAAVFFACRASETKRAGDLLVSLLAFAVLTNIKQTNLLLFPLWFLPFARNAMPLFKRPFLTGAVAMMALLASAVPISIANARFMGTWKGFPATYDPPIEPASPIWGILGNAFAIPAQNLLPPVFPFAGQWNQAMRDFLQTPLGANLRGFDSFGMLQRAPSEQNAGIGFAVTILVLITMGWLSFHRGRQWRAPSLLSMPFLLRWIPWGLLLVFMAKVGIAQNARYLAPLYPFLIATMAAAGGHRQLIRRRWWRTLAVATAFSTGLLLIVSRQRPLLPVDTAIAYLEHRHPTSPAAEKINRSFRFAQEIRKGMADFMSHVPAEEKILGYATKMGNNEVALWRPFGSRKVERVLLSDEPERPRSKGVRYVVVEPMVADDPRIGGIEKWLAKYQAELVFKTMLRLDPEFPFLEFYLVRLLPDGRQTRVDMNAAALR